MKKTMLILISILLVISLCSCNVVKDPLDGHKSLQVYIFTESGGCYYSIDSDMKLFAGTFDEEDSDWVERKIENSTLEPPSNFTESIYCEFPTQRYDELRDTLRALENEKEQFATFDMNALQFVNDGEFTNCYVWLDDVGYFRQQDFANNYLITSVAREVAMCAAIDCKERYWGASPRVNLSAGISLSDDLASKTVSYNCDNFFDAYIRVKDLEVNNVSELFVEGDNIIYQRQNELFRYNVKSAKNELLMKDIKYMVSNNVNMAVLKENGDFFEGVECKKITSGVDNIWVSNSYRIGTRFCYEQDSYIYFIDTYNNEKILLEDCPKEIMSVAETDDWIIVIDDKGLARSYDFEGKLMRQYKTSAAKLYPCEENIFVSLENNGKLVILDSNKEYVVAQDVKDVECYGMDELYVLNDNNILDRVIIKKNDLTIGSRLNYLTIKKEKLMQVDNIYNVNYPCSVVVGAGDELYFLEEDKRGVYDSGTARFEKYK